MTWLVTGGAGYIGAHVVRAFAEQGIDTVVLDDLSTGRHGFVPRASRSCTARSSTAPARAHHREHDVTGVVHVAGFKYAGVSVQRPLHTYEQNVTGTATLLAAMEATASTDRVLVERRRLRHARRRPGHRGDSDSAPSPPTASRSSSASGCCRPGARGRAARTPACATSTSSARARPIYDTSPHNLFPLVFDALLDGRTPRINGDDYATPDGTCVRDYVHVADLAAAHVAAARRLDAGEPIEPVYNLGIGRGVSVGEIMRAVAAVTGIASRPRSAPRRAGDPARIVASGDLAARDLDWRMRHALAEMVASAWEARRAAPTPERTDRSVGDAADVRGSKITSPEDVGASRRLKPRRPLEIFDPRLDSGELHRCNWS